MKIAYVIIRGGNGRRHEVDFEDADITVELYAGEDDVQLVIEAPFDEAPSDKKRFALVSIPRHLWSKAMADLARKQSSRAQEG